MHLQITQTGAPGLLCPIGPDDQCRADGHQLPEHEQCNQVAGQYRTQCRAGIYKRRYKFQRVRLPTAEQHAGECHQGESNGEKPAEIVGQNQG